MTTSALAVLNNNLAPQSEVLALSSGLGFGDSFIRPSFVELTQKMSKKGTPGKLYDVLTGTEYDEMQIVPLNVGRKRVLFPDGGGFGATPICRSDNGVVPSPFAQFPQNPTCDGCSHSSWDNYDKKTKKGKPDCRDTMEILFIHRETGLPRKINFSGSGLAPAKMLLERLYQDCKMAEHKFVNEAKALIAEGQSQEDAARNATNRPTNIFDYAITMAPELVSGGSGIYYVPKFTNVRRIAAVGEFGPLYEKYVLSVAARKAEQEDAEVVDAVVEEAVTV